MIGKTNAGGGGSFARAGDAVLEVTVPVGSSVTISKGGVTKGATSWVDSDDQTSDVFLFAIRQSQFDSSPWTVTATLNSSTATLDVVVNASGIYRAALSYVLPAGYRRVAYIASDGNGESGPKQYIDTGISANTIGRIVIKGRITADTNYMSLFGVCDNATNLGTGKAVAYIPYSGLYWVTTDNAEQHISLSAASVAAGSDFEIEAVITSTYFSIDVNGAVTSSMTGTIGNVSTRSLWLFACNYYQSGASKWLGGVAAQIEEAQIYSKSDTLLADYIPCVDTSNPSNGGFYDTVSETFKAGGDAYLVPGPYV